VRFYIDANPAFGEGNGLLTLIPVTLANALLSLFGVGFHAFKKKLGAGRNPCGRCALAAGAGQLS
jgi:hypothetical protein